ncbi:MAG: type II toxin-antitoxin system RelE/ParE family toxin [Saccharospirillaceae bacterium]|nr:type II toxin-antitoxin system RelE/ParE family toxin [Pseudomonadales bacterium]NRB77784.1 type II toxin-antitoxin system RelE/ParE family toxin [Saccharospirillaceae bacterium]
MSDAPRRFDVYESRRFTKALDKLTESDLVVVEDEIEKIILDPEIGTQKKGGLSHLWVHKFKMDRLQVLLGYSWFEGKLELYLLNISSHDKMSLVG